LHGRSKGEKSYLPLKKKKGKKRQFSRGGRRQQDSRTGKLKGGGRSHSGGADEKEAAGPGGETQDWQRLEAGPGLKTSRKKRKGRVKRCFTGQRAFAVKINGKKLLKRERKGGQKKWGQKHTRYSNWVHR